jgi:hypothetical protein
MSTYGNVLMIGFEVISWFSMKQPIATLSTIVAEFMTSASFARQAILMKGILCDYSSKIKLSRNHALHGRSQ